MNISDNKLRMYKNVGNNSVNCLVAEWTRHVRYLRTSPHTIMRPTDEELILKLINELNRLRMRLE